MSASRVGSNSTPDIQVVGTSKPCSARRRAKGNASDLVDHHEKLLASHIIPANHASRPRVASRALRDRVSSRKRRDGRGLGREGHEARPRRRDQDPPGRVHDGRGAARAVRARGARAGVARPSWHRVDSRHRGSRRRPVPRHAARRGRGPRRSTRARSDSRRRGDPDRDPDRRRARGGTRAGASSIAT